MTATDESDYCNVCYMLNHEWMKHGSCYSNSTDTDADTDTDPQTYFINGLSINELLSVPSLNISQLAGQQDVLTQDIRDFYPVGIAVNVICDAFNKDSNGEGGAGTFMEVQTCWEIVQSQSNKGSGNLVPGSSNSFNMVSCKPASDSHFTVPCPTYVNIPEF